MKHNLTTAIISVSVILIVLFLFFVNMTGFAALSVPTNDSTTCYDPGMSLETSDSCTDGIGTYEEYCTDSVSVNELGCYDGVCRYVTYGCRNYGYNSCSDGTCVYSELDIPIINVTRNLTPNLTINITDRTDLPELNTTSNLTCIDTDFGIDYYKFGTISTGIDNLSDMCSGTTLMEMYCSDDSIPSYEFYNCEQSCSNGTCVMAYDVPIITNLSCIDSDGGKKYETFGSVKVGNTTPVLDICADTTVLAEAYCTGENRGDITFYNCSNGCVDGYCAKVKIGNYTENYTGMISSCNETGDFGIDYYIYGEIVGTDQYGEYTLTDLCEDNNTLRELYCNDTGSASVTFNCSCAEGMCTGLPGDISSSQPFSILDIISSLITFFRTLFGTG